MQLVEDYKYKSIRAAAQPLASLLDAVLPRPLVLTENRRYPHNTSAQQIVIVPLPTIQKHIRERGFDHTWLLARKLAKLRGYHAAQILERRNKTVQVGANEEQRRQQALGAYGVRQSKINALTTYLLIDDVWTTGASMDAAIDVMRKAGAKKIISAVLLMPKKINKSNTENY